MSVVTAGKRIGKMLKVLAAKALALAPERLDQPVTVRDRDEDHEVLVQVAPIGSGADPSGVAFPGKYFSTLESAIWMALAGGAMSGSGIAARIGQPYDTNFKIVLRNLKDREVIVRDGDGYSRAPISEEI